MRAKHGFFAVLAATMVACGGSDDSSLESGSAGSGGEEVDSGGTGGGAGSAGTAGGGGVGGEAGSPPSGGSGGSGSEQDAGVDAPAPDAGADVAPQPVPDPALAGSFEVVSLSENVTVPATNSTVSTVCFHPADGTSTYPLVTLAPGFQLPGSQFHGSAAHLASFGFVVCVPQYNAALFNPDHVKNAKEVLGVVDWATSSSSPLGGRVDATRIGAAGHSLGGRLSVLAASMDDRIDAVLGIDPVDSDDPDATELLPLPIPTGFLGETLDTVGSFQACAPAQHNFETFFARAGSPSFKVEVNGANHMSFLDDPSTCGLVCSFCQPPTRDHQVVLGLTRSYLAAFFLRHLEGETAYDEYLVGAVADERYVQTGIAGIVTK